jgi:hypothetical protein
MMRQTVCGLPRLSNEKAHGGAWDFVDLCTDRWRRDRFEVQKASGRAALEK